MSKKKKPLETPQVVTSTPAQLVPFQASRACIRLQNVGEVTVLFRVNEACEVSQTSYEFLLEAGEEIILHTPKCIWAVVQGKSSEEDKKPPTPPPSKNGLIAIYSTCNQVVY